MSHLRHVDLVISLVRTDPFDPDDGLLEIDRHHEAIVIALDVEDNPLAAPDNVRVLMPASSFNYGDGGAPCKAGG
jgi:hypothetical protein